MKERYLVPLVVGASTLIAQLLRELQVAKIVNSMVRWDPKQWKLSPGTLVCALIINIIISRRPLYKVAEFYHHLDVPPLFDEPATAGDFNDDALARTLSRVAEIDKRKLIQTVSCNAVCHDHIPIDSVHADTTSVSLYGEFDAPTEADKAFLAANPEQSLLAINHGHSKAHRPDLKQFLYGLIVSKEGFPLDADVKDGNTSDKTWHRETLEALQESFLDPKAIVYVGDSALVTPTNLELMEKYKIRFISRLPETYHLADEVKTAAYHDSAWTDHGKLSPRRDAAAYQSASYTRILYNRLYRFVVVWSSSLDQRKWKSIQKKMANEAKTLAKAVKDLHKCTFNCREDAEAELARFLKEQSPAYRRLSAEVRSEERIQRRPGRPRKDAPPPTVTVYTIACSIHEPDEAFLQELRAKASMFVLITTLPESQWSNGAVLIEYKEQIGVEQRFHWVKHPLIVDGIFVKSQHRAEALAYIVLLAMILGAYLEQRIRRELQETSQTVELHGKRITNRPTIQAILEVMAPMQIIIENAQDGAVHRILPSNTDPRCLAIIHLAGYDERIYLRGG